MEKFCITEERLGLKLSKIKHKKAIDVALAAKISGFSRQYIYNEIKTGELPAIEYNKRMMISWNRFLIWYARLPTLPDSPFGKSSYSLKGFMAYTGMSRSWILDMAKRRHIPDYFIFKSRRYDRRAAEKAWEEERIHLSDHLTEAEAMKEYGIRRKKLYLMVGKHLVRCKYDKNMKLYNSKDIKRTLKTMKYV